MHNPELVNRIQQSVNELRSISEAYHLLDEEDRREVRHITYQKLGKFGHWYFDNVVPELGPRSAET